LVVAAGDRRGDGIAVAARRAVAAIIVGVAVEVTRAVGAIGRGAAVIGAVALAVAIVGAPPCRRVAAARLGGCDIRLRRSDPHPPRRLRLDLADRLLERQALARDVRLAQSRRRATQLIDQCRAGTFVERTTCLAGVLLETGNRAGDEWIVVGHQVSIDALRITILCWRGASLCSAQVSNGLRTRMVSSRSGLVDSSPTEQPPSSSIRRTYLIAGAGSSAHDRAPAVRSRQPAMVS